MQSRINFHISSKAGICLCLVLLAILAGGFHRVCLGAEPAHSAEAASVAAAEKFPHIARITGDNVYIRSGPGTNYYFCGNVNRNDAVKVVGRLYSWSRIVPPAGSFSWISKQYVDVDDKNSGVGIVTGDNVRVWAGAEGRKPIHSDSMQIMLDAGEKVKLLGVEQQDYYKITPPKGAYLWLSTEYTMPITSKPTIGTKVPEGTETPKPPGTLETDLVVSETTSDADALNKFYVLKERIDAERKKPVSRQNYSELKKSMAAISKSDKAGKAARYANFVLGRIERYELALKADRMVKVQRQQLEKIEARIDEALNKKLSEIPDLGKYAVVGALEKSGIYSGTQNIKRYRVVDRAGTTLCYAVPTGEGVSPDWSKFVGKKVGLVGTIEAHQQSGGALVRFMQIEILSE